MSSVAADRNIRWTRQLGDHVDAIAVRPGGALVAAGSLAGDARLFSLDDGQPVAELAAHPFGVSTIGWSPDGRHLAVGGQDGTVNIWTEHGELVGTIQTGTWITAVSWSPTDAVLGVASGKTVVLADPDGTVRSDWPTLVSTVTDLAWSVDGRRLGAACYGGVTWFDVDRTDSAAREFAWKGSILTLEISPDGRWLASGNQDNTVQVWRLWSADDMQMTGYPAKVTCVAWDHTSRWLAVANRGDTTVWDFRGKGPRGTKPAVLDGHEGMVTALAWQHDASVLASGGDDGDIALWRAGRSFRLVTSCSIDGSSISRLAWSTTDRTLVAATTEGTIAAVTIDDDQSAER
ncbi:MAG: WD40 repeat domain-containing protein [Acidimicrobiales bacterium]